MRKIYLSDNFTFDFLSDFPVKIIIDNIDRFEFCEIIDNEDVKNTITNDLIIQAINLLCDIKLEKNETKIKLQKEDKLYIVKLTENIPKGKILTYEEILKLYKNGKLQIFEIIVD